MSQKPFVVIANPAAGNGRGWSRVNGLLERLRRACIPLHVYRTERPGHAAELARSAYRAGYRRFLGIGGDGTAFEILNGLFPDAAAAGAPELALLPAGTGNSFLRDFTRQPERDVIEAILQGRARRCDVFQLEHAGGTLFFINLLSLGFAADVAAFRNRHFRRGGQLGYLVCLLACLARLRPQSFPLQADDEPTDARPCLFLSFNNSRFTGGKMLIAPMADPADGLIEMVRWEPIGRLRLLWNLPGLYTGRHIHHRLASRRPARRITFLLERRVNAMVDGESLELQCRRLDVLPGALWLLV
jgi:YegS/Rv2252/BmrU family lipid kinase